MGRLSSYVQPNQISELPIESIGYLEGRISELIYNGGAKKYKVVFTYTDLKINKIEYFESFDGGSTFLPTSTETFNYVNGIFTGITL